MPDLFDSLAAALADAVNAGGAAVQECLAAVDALTPKAPLIAINAPKIVLVRKAYQAEGDRLRVNISASAGFAGTGTLTAPANIRLFDAQGVALPLPYANIPGAQLSAGIVLLVEATAPSAAMGDVALTLTLAGGPAPLEANPATDHMSCVELKLQLCHYKPVAGGADPAPLAGETRVDTGRNIHLQTDNHYAGRVLLVVRQAEPAAYAGDVVLRSASGRLRIFGGADEVSAAGQVALAMPLATPNSTIPAAGRRLWVEGASVSAALRDAGLQLEISDLPLHEGDRANLTVLKTVIDLCQSRTTVAQVTVPIAAAGKMSSGRYLHVQDPGNHHGRARVILHPVEPAPFAGDVDVVVWDATANSAAAPRVRLFADELPGAAAALALPHPVTCPAGIPAPGGLALWAEGASVSAALRDTQLRVKVSDAEGWGDAAAITVCQFSELGVQIPSTPSTSARATFPAPAIHTYKLASPAPGANDFDDDYATNAPIVLIENSILASDQVRLSVVVAPVGVPVRWHALRDRRPAPQGDHADIIALAANREAPTLESAGETLTNGLLADAVGSFHVCAFVDCNGSNVLDYMDRAGARIDREPFIMLNLVLVRVTAVQNDSVGQASQCRPIFSGAARTAANFGGFTTSSTGSPWTGPTSGWHAKAKVDVIGGGPDGKRGLDKVFGGWIQHIFLNGILNTYEIMPGTLRSHRYIFASNLPDGTHPGQYHYIGAAEAPVDPAEAGVCIGTAPAIDGSPILDVTPYPDSGTGGDSAVGSTGFQGGATANHGGYPAATARPMGERWTRDMWDAPAIGCSAGHMSAGGNLVRFKFHLGFRTDLCFWTNLNRSPNADLAPTAVANRLYSAVYSNTWTPEYEVTFDAVTGASTVVTVPKVPITSVQTRPDGHAGPLLNMETRAPVALAWYAVDART